MSKEKQIEGKACKNCIHYQMCVDTFRKAKQDGEILLIEEDAYFAEANGCDFYADKRIYRKQSEGEWTPIMTVCNRGKCNQCNEIGAVRWKYCPNCGAKMKGGAE